MSGTDGRPGRVPKLSGADQIPSSDRPSDIEPRRGYKFQSGLNRLPGETIAVGLDGKLDFVSAILKMFVTPHWNWETDRKLGKMWAWRGRVGKDFTFPKAIIGRGTRGATSAMLSRRPERSLCGPTGVHSRPAADRPRKNLGPLPDTKGETAPLLWFVRCRFKRDELMQMANLAGTKVGGRREGKGLTDLGRILPLLLSAAFILAVRTRREPPTRRLVALGDVCQPAGLVGVGRSYLAVTSVTSITFVFLVTVTRSLFKSNFPNPASQSRANLLSAAAVVVVVVVLSLVPRPLW